MRSGGAAALIILLVAAACGGESNSPTSAPTATPASTTTPASTSAPAPTATSAPTVETWDPPTHWIAIEGGSFVDLRTGADFVPRGVNYVRFLDGADRAVDPVFFDATVMATDFERLRSAGFNTARLFIDSCQCSSDLDGIRDTWLDTLAEALAIAADNGVALILTSNDLPDARYGAQANTGASSLIDGYRNAHMLTAEGHAAFVSYWDGIMTGLIERRAHLEAVLGWSILNEQWLFESSPPFSLAGDVATRTGTYDPSDPVQRQEMVADNMRALISDVVEAISQHDPHALVTMGIFAPRYPNPTEIGGDWLVDTAPLVERSELDFYDFHAYPGGDLGVAGQAENFAITDAKPVVMGEVGAFVHLVDSAESAAVEIQRWIADSCAVGFDGWLYWAFDRIEPASDATWGLTDADGFLFDALSPAGQPDPCVPTLTNPNIAIGHDAAASRSLPDEPPMLAVDGSASTQWGAGADAPHWIEIDLTTPTSIGAVRLRVAQFPAGPTVHRVDATFADGRSEEVARFEASTEEGDVLEADFSPALEGVVTIRVTTIASPSWVAWKEVEILRP